MGLPKDHAIEILDQPILDPLAIVALAVLLFLSLAP
jgi:hypothetical protein